MLKIITQCISDNQIGFMPRTFLAESTMLVKLIQAHLDTIDEGGLLVFLDLEKAFDRVSWDFMKKAIKKLRFTDGIQKWMDALYEFIPYEFALKRCFTCEARYILAGSGASASVLYLGSLVLTCVLYPGSYAHLLSRIGS